MEENEWLECAPWDGDERSLPLGGRIAVPGVHVTAFVKRYIVLRNDEMITVGKKDLQKGDVVIDAVMDDELYNSITRIYGERAVTIAKSESVEKGITRKEWKEQYGTDGLKLWAIRNARLSQSGGGVRIG
jgi:hypothetical protein